MWLLYTPGFLINHFVSLPLIVPTMNNSSQSPTESQDSIRVNSLSRILRPTVYCLIFTLGLVYSELNHIGFIFHRLSFERCLRGFGDISLQQFLLQGPAPFVYSFVVNHCVYHDSNGT